MALVDLCLSRYSRSDGSVRPARRGRYRRDRGLSRFITAGWDRGRHVSSFPSALVFAFVTLASAIATVERRRRLRRAMSAAGAFAAAGAMLLALAIAAGEGIAVLPFQSVASLPTEPGQSPTRQHVGSQQCARVRRFRRSALRIREFSISISPPTRQALARSRGADRTVGSAFASSATRLDRARASRTIATSIARRSPTIASIRGLPSASNFASAARAAVIPGWNCARR